MLPRLPYLNQKTSASVSAFGGINLSEKRKEGDLRDSLGLTSDLYPCLASAPEWKRHEGGGDIEDLFCLGEDTYLCRGDKLYKNGEEIYTVTPGKKQFAAVGERLVIWPDKIIVDIATGKATSMGVNMQIDMADESGILKDGFLSVGNPLLWNEPGLFTDFQKGDCISIKGTPFGINDCEKTFIREVSANKKQLTFREGDIINASYYTELDGQWKEGDTRYFVYVATAESGGERTVVATAKAPSNLPEGSILFVAAGETQKSKGQLHLWDESKKKIALSIETDIEETSDEIDMTAYTVQGVITVQTKFPELDYICEKDGRLWGVSNVDKKVYASAVGEPKIFYSEDTSKDAPFSLEVRSEGEFTAVCSYSGALLCFKEDRLCKLLGATPSQYYLTEYSVTGVQKGSERSICLINEVLYYKGEQGVYTYSGGTPHLISYALGREKLCDCVAFAHDGKYHLSGTVGEKGVHYVFDTLHGVWLKEENRYVSAFSEQDGSLVCLSEGHLYSRGEEKGFFSLEMQPVWEKSFLKKRYTRLLLRLTMKKGAYIKVYAGFGSEAPKYLTTRRASRDETFSLPLPMRRCDSFVLRLEGYGDVVVREIAREFCPMSEV